MTHLNPVVVPTHLPLGAVIPGYRLGVIGHHALQQHLLAAHHDLRGRGESAKGAGVTLTWALLKQSNKASLRYQHSTYQLRAYK